MKQSLFRRYLLLVSTFLLAVYFILPTFWPEGSRPAYFLSNGLKLGLDLQGGTHLTLQVAVDEAIKANAESRSVDLESRMAKDGLVLAQPAKVTIQENTSQIEYTFKSADERERGRKLLEDQVPGVRLELGNAAAPTLLVRGNPADTLYLRKNAVDRALEIIRSRIDEFGVAEPVLIKEGEDRIVLQLPGLKDEKQALRVLEKTGDLKFKIVHDSNRELTQLIQQAQASGTLPENPTEAQYLEALKPLVQSDAEVSFMIPIRDKEYEDADWDPSKEPPQPIILRSRTELTGAAVVDAYVQRDQQSNEPEVHIRLNPTGARVFEELTGANVNKLLAIVLDGKVKSSPNIQSRIGGGSVRITGQFTEAEAAELALVLRSGALPAPIHIVQNITVGPTLGKDSINAGFISAMLGFLLVCIFMAYYYRLSGIIADAALLLNNVLLMGSLAFLDATLTLPGIAGIVLTMGMAVDSNVLIFERIREELDIGRPIPPSIRAGFDKAFWTIIDSHVTTLITAFVLFEFGTGPIKGFAVTLSIGVTLNLFTALVGTKVVYDHLLMLSKIRHLKFRQLIHRPDLDFVRARKPAFVISAILVVLGFVALVQVQRGAANLGIDFAGGTIVTLSSSQAVDAADARKAVESVGVKDAQVQLAGLSNQILVRVHQQEGNPAALQEKLLGAFQKQFNGVTFKVEGAQVIGAAVSQDLKSTSVLAVLISLIGIIGYLSLRFDFRFGVAAALATFHDVLAVLAFFWITGKQIDLLLVTALLTLAGYSLTDTVVVFDRIRETRQRHPGMSIGQVINSSVNEVLSRTLITSTTVLLVLVALYFFGGAVLHEFSLALLLGVFVGTYSSVFVASPILYEWETRFGRLQEHDEKGRPIVAATKG